MKKKLDQEVTARPKHVSIGLSALLTMMYHIFTYIPTPDNGVHLRDVTRNSGILLRSLRWGAASAAFLFSRRSAIGSFGSASPEEPCKHFFRGRCAEGNTETAAVAPVYWYGSLPARTVPGGMSVSEKMHRTSPRVWTAAAHFLLAWGDPHRSILPCIHICPGVDQLAQPVKGPLQVQTPAIRSYRPPSRAQHP